MTKSCSTCEHRKGSDDYARCMNSGFICHVERKHPSVCGEEFEGWTPRRGLFVRLKQFFIGCSYGAGGPTGQKGGAV